MVGSGKFTFQGLYSYEDPSKTDSKMVSARSYTADAKENALGAHGARMRWV